MSARRVGGRPRIAVVHDQLYTYGGAERVLEQILLCFPSADIFALFEIIDGRQRNFLQGRRVRTTFMQKFPGLKRFHRHYFPVMPLLIEQLDLGAYDIIISSSYLVAKGVIAGPDQLHIGYVHSPMRYAWDLQHDYLREMKLGFGPRGLAARVLLHYMRMWDFRSAAGVDHLVANSEFIARRISKTYRRDAHVIYPPVDLSAFEGPDGGNGRENVFVTMSRLVPYKRVRTIVQAFRSLPDQRLVVIGTGPELDRVRRAAGPNVEVLGHQPREVVVDLMRRAVGFVYAAEEDFGIAAVEAQAAGTPVIAYGRGGLCETVNGLSSVSPTGVFFEAQTEEAIAAAVRQFLAVRPRMTARNCRTNARRFGAARFRSEFTALVEEAYETARRRQRVAARPAPLIAVPEERGTARTHRRPSRDVSAVVTGQAVG